MGKEEQCEKEKAGKGRKGRPRNSGGKKKIFLSVLRTFSCFFPTLESPLSPHGVVG